MAGSIVVGWPLSDDLIKVSMRASSRLRLAPKLRDGPAEECWCDTTCDDGSGLNGTEKPLD